jgi:hypothetical protein
LDIRTICFGSGHRPDRTCSVFAINGRVIAMLSPPSTETTLAQIFCDCDGPCRAGFICGYSSTVYSAVQRYLKDRRNGYKTDPANAAAELG